jgi:WD40 repeat protein
MTRNKRSLAAVAVVAGSLVAGAGVLSCRAAEEPPPAQPEARQEQASFVKRYQVKGAEIEAGFVPYKTEIVLGEPLTVTFRVKNVSDRPFAYEFGGDYRGIGRHERYKVRAKDAGGRLLPDPLEGRSDMGGIGGERQVKPGEAVTEEVNLALYRTFNGPGTYTVTCGFDLGTMVETTYRLTILPRTGENVRRVRRELAARARRDHREALARTVDILVTFAGEEAVADLAALLRDGDTEHRAAALGGLGRFATRDAVAAALEALRDPDQPVRVAAAGALGSMKTGAAVDGLLARLPEESPPTLGAVLVALGRTQSPKALPHLVRALERSGGPVRHAAVEALKEYGGPDGVAVLKRWATGADLDVREEAARALVESLGRPLQPEWVVPVIRAGKRYPSPGGPNPSDGLRLLRLYGGPHRVALMISCLDFDNPSPRLFLNMLILDYEPDVSRAFPNLHWLHDPNSDGTPEQLASNRQILRRMRSWLATYEKEHGNLMPVLDPAPLTRPDREAAARITALVRRLGSDQFGEREAAVRELEALGEPALAALRQAASGEDPEVRQRADNLIVRIRERGQVRCLTGHDEPVRGVALSADGRRAVSCGNDHTVRVWDTTTGKELRSCSGHTDAVLGVALAPDGRQVLSAGRDGTVRLWDVATGRERHAFTGLAGEVWCVAFAPDGKRALSGGKDGTLRLWDLDAGRELHRFEGHTDGVESVAFAPDGRRALSGGDDGSVRLWDLDGGRELRRFTGHTNWVTGVAFTPDGRQALSGSWDRTLRLWDVDTGREVRRFLAHGDRVCCVALSPDGRRALSGSFDTTLRLWDVATGEELGRFQGHTDLVSGVAFSADGTRALSGSYDRTVRLSQLPATARDHSPP